MLLADNSFAREMWMKIAMEPRRKTVRWADHHQRMSAHWVEHAQSLGRPPYHEADAFTPDRWMLKGSKTFGRSICGGEVPYGYTSLAMWRVVWKAMLSAFLSAWHEQMAGTYTYIDDARYRPVIRNLVA